MWRGRWHCYLSPTSHMAHNPLKFRTIDAVYNLGSFPIPKKGRNVAAMDKVVAQEIQGVICYESDKRRRRTYPGFVLNFLFSDFADSIDLPPPESLHATQEWLEKHTPEPLYTSFSERPSEFPLYDSQLRRWNWPPFDGTTIAKTSQESLVASFFNVVAHCLAEQVIPAREKAVESLREDSEDTESVKENNDLPIPHRHWLSTFSSRRLPGTPKGAGAYHRCPDLILIESADQTPGSLSWMSPTVLAEYTSEKWTPGMRLAKTLHTKAYLTLLDQPWRRFVLCMSLCQKEMRVHFYDRSGAVVSPPFDINAEPHFFIAVLSAVVFGPRLSVGFDPTISISPTRPLRVVPHRAIHFTSSTPSTIQEDEKGEAEAEAEADLEVGLEADSEASGADLEADSEADETEDVLNLDEEDADVIIPTENILGTRPRIGQIKLRDNTYDILDILFSSPGFFGRGTVIYLASLNGRVCVIKDHWIESLQVDNEAAMMHAMEGVPGVPQILEHWQVEVAPGITDKTRRYRPEGKDHVMKGKRCHNRIVMSPRGRLITDFKSKRELVHCIRDVLVGKSLQHDQLLETI